MVFLRELSTALSLVVAGIVISVFTYFLGIELCILLMKLSPSDVVRNMGSMYVSMSIPWIISHGLLSLALFYIFLRWAGSGKTRISSATKAWISTVVSAFYIVAMTALYSYM